MEGHDTLENLEAEVRDCQRCNLAERRNQVIFGEGPSRAPILIIAEAPGRDEDQEGRPFVGKSGLLLDKILAACGFNRNQHVYISNIVKCRPPGNRTPLPEEIRICLPYLLKQIDLIDPAILILMGATALKSMAGDHQRITRIRGRWISIQGRQAMPVYHPSALLRNPALKRPTWEDFKQVVRYYRETIDPGHYSPHIP